ncbi:MAG: methionyl-tRNA synthetase [Francisellaceae bacterium]|jgi:methionyl-tRNA synthetase
MRKILVTNALPYANGHLHLGHMLGYIQSDIWVRHQKMQGNTCYFVCGSDCHGTPIMLQAKKMGIKPERLAEEMTASHLSDFIDFEVEFDNYQSTHNQINQQIVEETYLKLQENGLIETKTIEQSYDQVANIFLPDRYVKGTCPKCRALDQYGDNCEVCGSTYSPEDLINPLSVVSNTAPIKKESEHYFFKLSLLSKNISNWLKNNKKLQPEVVNKLKEWLNGNLKDWDISRDSPYFGYKIPGTADKYFYVWMDAPLGYLASFKDLCDSIGVDFDSYWRENDKTEVYHFIGKDIIYFHALFWPAILEAADYRKPTGIFANGFLTINGAKMSKSRGTFILAKTYLKHLDPEYIRYYFASKLTPGIDDIDLSLEDFTLKVNSDIVGKVINIASRCAGFISKKFDGMLSSSFFDEDLLNSFIQEKSNIIRDYENREFSSAMKRIMALADKANQFIDYHKPWQIAKNEGNTLQVQEICSLGLNLFKILITYLKPVLPKIASKSEDFLNIDDLNWENIQEPLYNHKIEKFKPLLTRVEVEKIEAIFNESKSIQKTLT